jgi:hypothetical protein
MLFPAAVVNENVAPVIVVCGVTLATSTVKLAEPFRNGLCGPLPAIEGFALLYTPIASAGPMMVWLGPDLFNAVKLRPPALGLNVQPVGTLDPVVPMPLPLMVISWPLLLARDAPVVAPLNVKLRSLSTCVALLGFANKLFSVIVMSPDPVVNVTLASTGSPPTMELGGVAKMSLAALACSAAPQARAPSVTQMYLR